MAEAAPDITPVEKGMTSDLQARDLDVNVIFGTLCCGRLHLGLSIIQCALDCHMCGPRAVEVLVERIHVQRAQDLIVVS